LFHPVFGCPTLKADRFSRRLIRLWRRRLIAFLFVVAHLAVCMAFAEADVVFIGMDLKIVKKGKSDPVGSL
jgi:hypothetical protein